MYVSDYRFFLPVIYICMYIKLEIEISIYYTKFCTNQTRTQTYVDVIYVGRNVNDYSIKRNNRYHR